MFLQRLERKKLGYSTLAGQLHNYIRPILRVAQSITLTAEAHNERKRLLNGRRVSVRVKDAQRSQRTDRTRVQQFRIAIEIKAFTDLKAFQTRLSELLERLNSPFLATSNTCFI